MDEIAGLGSEFRKESGRPVRWPSLGSGKMHLMGVGRCRAVRQGLIGFSNDSSDSISRLADVLKFA